MESHSPVKVSAIVIGSKMPAKRAVACQPGKNVAVQCKQIYVWEVGRGRLAKQLGSANREDGDQVTIFRMPTIVTRQLRGEYNTREQGHQSNYFTDSSKLATVY